MLALYSFMMLLAEDEEKKPEPSLFGNPIFLIPIVLLLFWMLVMRPAQKRQEKERLALANLLVKNDRIITSGGIYGVVHSINDDEVVLKLEDNAKMRIMKSVIFRNMSQEERLKTPAAPPSLDVAPKPDEAVKEQKV
jgi:preprotein translocase subunit YajC